MEKMIILLGEQRKMAIASATVSTVAMIVGVLCCQGAVPVTDILVPEEPFRHERRAALATDAWGGMRVDWTAVADWPTGDSPVAKSVREWIEKRLRNYRKQPFEGNPSDWNAITRFYGKQFLADNGPKDIEKEWRAATSEPRTGAPDVKPGADIFIEDESRWFCRHSAIIEYEDEHIVSYRAGFYGFFVGNATSAAYVKCATFRKPDGKMLGWDAFSDTNAVFRLVRKLTEMKYKEKTDYAGVGVIPVPDAPLFTKDGFWVFWGDYTIVEGHPYEMNGAFPSLFVPWRDPTYGNRVAESLDIAASLLTQEAKVELGIVGLINQRTSH